MSELRLYNALGRSKQRFESIEPGRVRMYSCGPTVYSRQHIGNMRPYVFADVLKRTLELFGYSVRHVINITDVGHLTDDERDQGDDKMEMAAREAGGSVWDVAETFTKLFRVDIEKLNVRAPDVWCKATDHVPEQIALVEALEAKGLTYRARDGIYFDVSAAPHYGELTGVDLEAQRSDERIAATDKRHPADFVLWKLSPEDGPRRQMEWESPWGIGFPGWHIECSAMSEKYLGVPFDIHTGGVDHIPVHHTNEIVQSEHGFGTRPAVRYWMHNGWVMIDGGKISKSKGHTLNLDDLEAAGIAPLAFRYFLLGANYRQQMNFNEEAIRSADTAYRRLLRHAADLADAEDTKGADQLPKLRERFRDALADDLGTPQVLALLWEVVRSDALGSVEKRTLLAELDGVLALDLGRARVAPAESDARIDGLVRERDAARASKDWARADEIRDGLQAEGIVLEDSPQGTRWHRG